MPRKIRLTPEERTMRAAARMIPGTLAGRAESASPVRERQGAADAFAASSSSSHTHDTALANTTLVGGVAEAGAATPVALGPQTVVIGDWTRAAGVSGSFGGSVVIGAGDSAVKYRRAEAGPDAIGVVVIGAWGAGTGNERGPYAGGYQDVVIGQAAETIEEAAGGDNNTVVGPRAYSGGFGNVVIGYRAGAFDGVPAGNTPSDCVVIGDTAFSEGHFTVVIGESAGANIGNTTPTGGEVNLAVVIGEGAGVFSNDTRPDCKAAIAIGGGNGSSSSGGAQGKAAISIGGRYDSGFARDPAAFGDGTIAIGGQTGGSGVGARATAARGIAVGASNGSINGAAASHVDAIALGTRSATSAADQIAIDTRHIELEELAADPATPAANHLRLYAKDSGGVARLFYIDDGGTVRGPL